MTSLTQLRSGPTPNTSAPRSSVHGQVPACPCICLSRELRVGRSKRAAVTCSVATAEAPVAEERDIPDMGRDLWNRSYYPTGADAAALHKDWFIVDAAGQTLGRLAVLVSTYLRGKHRPTYTPSVDMGGFVVVVNAEKVIVTGSKASQKLYRRHTTGRPGSMKEETFEQLQARIPERIVEKAVKGMLPRGRLGNSLYRHLKVYDGPNHPHTAQQPQDITNQINLGPKAAAAARS